MKNEFDFDTIGKKMPYVADEEFFDRNAVLISNKITGYEKSRSFKKIMRILVYNAAALIVIAFVIGVLVIPNRRSKEYSFNSSSQSVDKILQTISNDDLNQLEIIAKSDPFLAGY
jgi:hypothetical protein